MDNYFFAFVLVALSSLPACAGELDKYKPQMQRSQTSTTSTTNGTIDTSKNTYVYGQQKTFNTGNNPRNDNSSVGAGVGYRFK